MEVKRAREECGVREYVVLGVLCEVCTNAIEFLLCVSDHSRL